MPMEIDQTLCQRCGACMMICPERAISEEKDAAGQASYLVQGELCDDCADQAAPLCCGECPVPQCLSRVG